MTDPSQPDDDRPDAGHLEGDQPGYGDPREQPGYPGTPDQQQGQQPGRPQNQEPGHQPGRQPGHEGYPQGYEQPGYAQGHPHPGTSYGAYGGYGNYGGYGGYGGYVPVPDHPQATTALTLGLVGMIGTMICGIPAVVGPFAWYMGAKVKREIDASGGQLGGRGQALTGFVLGIITTVLLVLGILGLGALIAVGIAGGVAGA